MERGSFGASMQTSNQPYSTSSASERFFRESNLGPTTELSQVSDKILHKLKNILKQEMEIFSSSNVRRAVGSFQM